MKEPNIAVYGSRSCPDTSRATRHLDTVGVQYEFKDVDESPEYNGYIAELNGGKRVIPTIRVDDAILINPDDAALDRAIEAAAAERA
jgi:glutaredoxin